MKRPLSIGLLSFLSLLASVSISYAFLSYQIKALTHTEEVDEFLWGINDLGHVVWTSNGQVFLYTGSTPIQISDPSANNSEPTLNNAGHVAWVVGDYPDNEIFLYDGTGTEQITDNDYAESSLDLNDNGQLVWRGSDGSDYEIFLYDGSGITQLTDNTEDDGAPTINNHGHVVWAGKDGAETVLFLYDGSSTSQITDNIYSNLLLGPQLNDRGDIIWLGDDDFELYLYDGSTIIQITDKLQRSYGHPRLNAQGKVVWGEVDGEDMEIFLYNGSRTVQITDNDLMDFFPAINDWGCITWSGGLDYYNFFDFQIFVYYGLGTSQVTHSPWPGRNLSPQINNNNQLAWQKHEYMFLADIWFGNPTTDLWAGATVIEPEPHSASDSLNYVVVLMVPVAVLLAWKRRRRR